ncbi:MAG: hypothetical protein WCT44_00925 [Candidatus Paceibacterota bacterium]
MDKNSKILLAIVVFLTVVSIYLTYIRSFVDKNYEVIPIPEETEESGELL